LFDGHGLIFPGSSGQPLSDMALSMIFRRLEIPATVHGMRSTFRDWAAENSDVPREIAEYALAHVEGSAAELAYRRSDYFDKRRGLMQDWADFVCQG
jgi:integrase